MALVRAKMFDPAVDVTLRSDVVGCLNLSVEEGFRFIATGYREHGTSPPTGYIAGLFYLGQRPQHEAEVRRGRTELLSALLARLDGNGALQLLNSIVSNAITSPRSDPWHGAVGAVLREIARGERAASADVRGYAAKFVVEFGG